MDLGIKLKSDFWTDRSVLVTGASGLVGGSLVRRLVDAGASVTALVRDWAPSSELVRTDLMGRVAIVGGDVTNQALVERALGEQEVETVFHLAAQTIVGIANRNPVSTFESNIQGTWALLEACRRSPRVQQVVVASSDKAYGHQDVLPYDETMPLQGQHPYDVSKSCADLIAHSYAFTYDLPVVVTRCGNFYGPGDLNWNRIVPGTIRSVLRGHRPKIRSDGLAVRDYFFVEDGAAAYMLLAEQLAEHPQLKGRAFNFSNEVQVTVRQLVDQILSVMGSSIEPILLNTACHEIRHQYLTASRARTELGWNPLYTLEQGLELTVPWYRRLLEVPA